MSQHVVVEQAAPGVLLIRLNRPEKKNALTGEMYRSVAGALARAEDDPAIRVSVITGSGGAFTAGNDLADFLAVANGDTSDRPAAALIGRLLDGTTLTFHCDLVYATPAATFRMPFVDLGLVPEAGSTHLLPHRVGMAKASELLLLGEGYGADEALRLGLINAVVPAERLLVYALEQAAKLADKPYHALREARRLLRGEGSAVRAAVDAEFVSFTRALQTPDAKAAFDAFVNRTTKRAAPSS
jgi:enoyl-CoA hydratase/carnithine racemase